MEEAAIPEWNREQMLFQQFAARYGGPAYVRRVQRLEEAQEQLFQCCRKQRDKCLREAQAQLRRLASLVGEWESLRPWRKEDASGDVFSRLQELLAVSPRFRAQSGTGWGIGGALRSLAGSLESFNQRWRTFLHKQDLKPINALRDGYNRYYVLEKECALRSARLARAGFQMLEPLTVLELLDRFPLLPVPRLG